MKRLGVTGGIGAGKSYVCRLLADSYGLPVYDCDREAKRLNQEDPYIRQRLLEMVGSGVYAADGTLNRPLLASYIFGHPSHLQAVNALVHPRVMADFLQWADRQEAPVVVMESAILHSSGFARKMDRVLCVDAPMELRIARVMERDHCSREQVLARIHSQADSLPADYVVQNDGTARLHEQLRTIVADLLATDAGMQRTEKQS